MSDAYLVEGERRAAELGNRGPLRFARDGNLEPDILEAYRRTGFYVFDLHASPHPGRRAGTRVTRGGDGSRTKSTELVGATPAADRPGPTSEGYMKGAPRLLTLRYCRHWALCQILPS